MFMLVMLVGVENRNDQSESYGKKSHDADGVRCMDRMVSGGTNSSRRHR